MHCTGTVYAWLGFKKAINLGQRYCWILVPNIYWKSLTFATTWALWEKKIVIWASWILLPQAVDGIVCDHKAWTVNFCRMFLVPSLGSSLFNIVGCSTPAIAKPWIRNSLIMGGGKIFCWKLLSNKNFSPFQVKPNIFWLWFQEKFALFSNLSKLFRREHVAIQCKTK